MDSIELTHGRKALDWVIKEKKDKFEAFHHVHFVDISLIYGTPGNPLKNFKGGYGISHIIEKRNHEAIIESDLFFKKFKKHKKIITGEKIAYKLIDVILNGKVTKTIESKKTVHFSKDGYEAVLSLDFHGNCVSWILTGYKIKKGL